MPSLLPVQALFTVWGFKFPLLIAFMQMAIIAPVTYIIARPSLNMSVSAAPLPPRPLSLLH